MDEYLAEALEIARSQAKVRPMLPEEVTAFAVKLSAAIKGIAEGCSCEAEAEDAPLPCSPKSSIRDSCIVCLVCGRKSKMITKSHLASHGLTVAQYKAKFGLKPSVNLVCRTTLKQQRERMAKMRPLAQRKAKAAG